MTDDYKDNVVPLNTPFRFHGRNRSREIKRKIFSKIRHWLIKKIACNDLIVMNAIISFDDIGKDEMPIEIINTNGGMLYKVILQESDIKLVLSNDGIANRIWCDE